MENLQMEFMESILLHYRNRTEAVDALEKILYTSRDGVYRRIRGDTKMSIEEVKAVAVAHKFSLDKFIHTTTNDVIFTFNSFDSEVKSVDDFVNNLLMLLKQFSLIPDAKLLYASAEIPVFYYAFIPEVYAFKLYVWARTVWNLPAFQSIKFSPLVITADTQGKFKELTRLYKHLPSTELWSYNIFDNTLNQIEYHLEGAFFEHPEDAVKLCDSLEKICEHMRAMATEGRKFALGESSSQGAEFQLYHNEIVYTNNTILYESPEVDLLFTTFCNPNFIRTIDARLIQFSKDWFGTIVQKSQSIVGQNERQRNKYFDGIKKRIGITRRRIELIVQEEMY
jgi:hypothetical protein